MHNDTIEAEVLDRQHQDEGVEDVLGWGSLSGARTPAEEAVDNERESVELRQREVDGVRSETALGLLSYFLREFERYPDAADVGRRVIAMAKFCGHRSISNWSATQLAKACNETPAAMIDRVRRECNQIIEAMGGVAKAKWQQDPTQREVSARVQQGNNNRSKGRAKYGRVTLADRKNMRAGEVSVNALPPSESES